jgi:hypothetical protein
VRPDDFTYPGQPPASREAAVVMLADAVEAATRSLKKPTMARLEQAIRDLIMDKFSQGQLAKSDLTFRDLETILNTFTPHFGRTLPYADRISEDEGKPPMNAVEISVEGMELRTGWSAPGRTLCRSWKRSERTAGSCPSSSAGTVSSAPSTPSTGAKTLRRTCCPSSRAIGSGRRTESTGTWRGTWPFPGNPVPNCSEFGVSENEELKRLILHGILHLAGMDHDESDPWGEMLEYQETLLKKFAEVTLI